MGSKTVVINNTKRSSTRLASARSRARRQARPARPADPRHPVRHRLHRGRQGPRRPPSLLHRRPLRAGDGRHHGARPRRQEPSRRLPSRPRRAPDGHVLREGLAAHPPHLRDRHQHPRRQRHLRRPDPVAPRRARVPRRHGPQPRALDEPHRPPHLLARHHHRDGRLLEGPRSSTPSPTSSTPARPSPTSSPSKSASARPKASASPTSATATTSATR